MLRFVYIAVGGAAQGRGYTLWAGTQVREQGRGCQGAGSTPAVLVS